MAEKNFEIPLIDLDKCYVEVYAEAPEIQLICKQCEREWPARLDQPKSWRCPNGCIQSLSALKATYESMVKEILHEQD